MVKSVYLNPFSAYLPPLFKPQTLVARRGGWLQRLAHAVGLHIDDDKRKASPSKLMQTMTNTLCSFPNVRHYTVTWRDPPTKVDPLPLHRKVWPTLSASLESLTLTTRFESFERMMDPPPTLPHLRFLSMTFALSEVASWDVINDKVAPFVNSLHRTLATLFLTLPVGLMANEFYDALSSKLTLSHVGFGGDLPLYPGAQRFLHRQVSTLKKLSFAPPKYFEGRDGRLSTPLATLLLPNLLNLNISLSSQHYWDMDDLQSNLEVYLRHFTQYSSLRLVGSALLPPDISCALQWISSPGLKNLHISVRVLSTSLFKLLAKELPNLEMLVVGYAELDRIGSGYYMEVDGLCRRLEDESSIVGWKLGRVGLVRGTLDDGLFLVEKELTMRVARMLPSAEAILKPVEDSEWMLPR